MNSSLMRSQQPTFEQRNSKACFWQQIISNMRVFSNDLTNIAQGSQLIVSIPTIGFNGGARIHTLFYGALQTVRRGIGDPAEANAPNPSAVLLRGHHYQSFPFFSQFFDAFLRKGPHNDETHGTHFKPFRFGQSNSLDDDSGSDPI